LLDCVYVVDALTSFGGVPLEMRSIDVLVGSSCKCLQGIPGVSCIVANKSLIERYYLSFVNERYCYMSLQAETKQKYYYKS